MPRGKRTEREQKRKGGEKDTYVERGADGEDPIGGAKNEKKTQGPRKNSGGQKSMSSQRESASDPWPKAEPEVAV